MQLVLNQIIGPLYQPTLPMKWVWTEFSIFRTILLHNKYFCINLVSFSFGFYASNR